ncbi:homologous-pairing protein 2 homolog [Bombus vosnesenskii]|uniref:Homologous-pairing protein 2 homolog n=2 Tax=Pyrobombus TaxID=144703 RepID=A0A6J3L3E8_9HYME|nr:homologous-pairing protein 2 homolog [Bombus vancouverensis nearcticus]XP_033199105.1 homologous-pairing protein 2 homolog [Bombus vancouverensis nearcticus]XP_033311298.1 homologous-pairing protein 2 homolog [Bombus bifarius]XP_033311299.1 homologous-pairing protein 2 homolog [Bombus bifarius]XP_033359781.1 homologous-pairing protein 2 homolog [Bombus vosnesenskii]XP_033359782.1 homologous-pairing protein 2 homolog [Bombus vosnesenskii]XP_050496855.1 homologous-pairing protein 2 homolog [
MTDTVYKYMKTQNRPYSINDLVSNLHNEYGKTAVQKAIDKLVAEGKIFEKVYGKQKIYCPVQDTSHDMDELMRMNRELQSHANEVEGKYQELQEEIKVQEALLLSIKSSITIEEAKKQKVKLKERIEVLTNKLDGLMEASGTEDLTETKRKAEEALNEYSREYSKRKRLCTDILDCILDNYPSSKTELYEEIGIDLKIV